MDPIVLEIDDAVAEITNKDYSVLSNKPQINGIELDGNKTSAELGLSADWGAIGGDIEDQEDLQEALDLKANTADIPTKVSDLTNDSGFQTEAQVETAATEIAEDTRMFIHSDVLLESYESGKIYSLPARVYYNGISDTGGHETKVVNGYHFFKGSELINVQIENGRILVDLTTGGPIPITTPVTSFVPPAEDEPTEEDSVDENPIEDEVSGDPIVDEESQTEEEPQTEEDPIEDEPQQEPEQEPIE